MIKIYLDEDFEDKEINKIYDNISKCISDRINNKQINLSCKYLDNVVDLNDKENIKGFLKAKDFYNYKFNYNCNNFIDDFRKLSKKIKLKSFFITSRSQSLNNFKRKYENSDCIKKLKNIVKKEEYDNRTLGEKSKEIIKSLDGNYIFLNEIFTYDNLCDESRHYILTRMNTKVCPYCNMNYTLSYNKNREKKTTADLDHFYIKSDYPEYALCLYNFVPACPVCNSKLKSQKNMTRYDHVFPHEEGYEGKAKFKIDNLIEKLLCTDKTNVDIKFDIYDDSNNKIENSEKIFNLEKMYQNHSDIAEDLLKKSQIYNDTYIQELSDSYADLFGNRELIKRLIFGHKLTEEEISNKSLGKFTMDILEQLGIY